MNERRGLMESLNYDAITGVFHWRINRGSRGAAGDVAGWLNPRGYRYLTVGKKHYIASRVAWLFTHGEWPMHEIDHINHDRDDNR